MIHKTVFLLHCKHHKDKLRLRQQKKGARLHNINHLQHNPVSGEKRSSKDMFV